MAPRPTTAPVLHQLSDAVTHLVEVRDARGWGVREMARWFGVNPGVLSGWLHRASTTRILPMRDAHARQFGHAVRLRLVEDRPDEPPLPWRQRIPYGDDPADIHAMTEVWLLQQRLHQMRKLSGRSREDLAAALGITWIAVWRLETSPGEVDRTLINVLVYARFFGHTLRFQLEPLDPAEVGGACVSSDDTVVHNEPTDTGVVRPYEGWW